MLPDHSPFSTDQRQTLNRLIQGLTGAQRFWLGGFLSAGVAEIAQSKAVAAVPTKLTVLYGTESGNSEKLADLSAKEAKKRGFQATVKNMADLKPSELSRFENLLVIVSTWGDGDAPDTATAFHKAFMTEAHDFSKLRFSVCSLGDSSYEKFCQIGKDFDTRLEALGARRVWQRQDCDLAYEEPHRIWLDGALIALAPAKAASVAVEAVEVSAVTSDLFGKTNPFPSEMLERVLLNGHGTKKETWHYELSLEGSGLNYEPGDALAVVPSNAPDMVDELLRAARLKGSETIGLNGAGEFSLAEALKSELDITALSRSVLTRLQKVAPSEKLTHLLKEESKDEFNSYVWGRWIADAVADFAPDGLAAAELVSVLRKIPARLYSIASSPLAHAGQVHLTVASVRYQANGKHRKGVASTFLADLVPTGEKVPVYIHTNKLFRLPASGETPVIMVGPGTGVAPFRAFVEHRAALGHTGKSWLFFGDQHYTYDFLYQVEWQEHLASGALSRLDVAFSRDQPEKLYVQQRMLEHSRELYAWLSEGAHFYVCGDASKMAKDVHETLIAVVEKEGGLSHENALTFVDELKKSKRYQRDVY